MIDNVQQVEGLLVFVRRVWDSPRDIDSDDIVAAIEHALTCLGAVDLKYKALLSSISQPLQTADALLERRTDTGPMDFWDAVRTEPDWQQVNELTLEAIQALRHVMNEDWLRTLQEQEKWAVKSKSLGADEAADGAQCPDGAGPSAETN